MSAKIETGGPAFPRDYKWNFDGTTAQQGYPGMSLRAYYAGKAMMAWRESEVGVPFESRLSSELLATLALEDADAMLAALAAPSPSDKKGV